MLNNEITLFNVSLQSGAENSTDERLILCSCKAKMFEKTYSEFDELTFALLNSNDYGHGLVEFEFSFLEKFKNPYMDFYVSCFSFRMDSLKHAIKKNGLKYRRKTAGLLPKNYTKVNKNGNLSMGICYFFASAEEREAFLNCKEICVEGFVAFGKRTNTYNIMCRLAQQDGEWDIIDAYTYRRNGNHDVYSYRH